MAHSHLFHPVVLACLGAYALTSTSVLAQQRPDSGTTQQQADRPKLVLPEFQPVTRDFAFIVPRATAAGDMLKTAQGAERALISDVTIFDIYEGTGVAGDSKSVALAVTLQPTEKTLTDVEIEAVAAKIIADMAKKFGATLRG